MSDNIYMKLGFSTFRYREKVLPSVTIKGACVDIFIMLNMIVHDVTIDIPLNFQEMANMLNNIVKMMSYKMSRLLTIWFSIL